MSNTLDTLRQTIETAHDWRRLSDGVYQATRFEITVGNEPRIPIDPNDESRYRIDTVVSTAQLHELNEDLPRILDSLLLVQAPYLARNNVFTIGRLFAANLAMLENRLIAVIDRTGAKRYFESLYGFEEHPTDKSHVWLSGYEWLCASAVPDEPCPTMLVQCSRQTLTVASIDLEKLYPGWQQRVAIARSLDIEGEDFLNYIFPVGNAKHPDAFANNVDIGTTDNLL